MLRQVAGVQVELGGSGGDPGAIAAERRDEVVTEPGAVRVFRHVMTVSDGREDEMTLTERQRELWNLLHMARLLRDAGGFPAHGNQRAFWDAGCRFDFANPEYR